MDRNIILKSFDDAIVKCKNSSYKARKIGDSVKHKSEVIIDEDNRKVELETFTYSNGMSVSFDRNHSWYDWGDGTMIHDEYWTVNAIMDNNISYNMLDEESYDFFQYQKEYIIKKYGQSGWDFFSEYADCYASSQGMHIGEILRGDYSWSDVTDEDGGFYISDFMVDNHKRFTDMLRDIPLDNKSFVSMRVFDVLHQNDSISKKVVSDKAHTSTSVNKSELDYDVYANTSDCWRVFTLVNEGSGVTGAFLGNGIRDYEGYDWEKEVNYAPNQKFERLVIDESNKIIIQKPIPIK